MCEWSIPDSFYRWIPWRSRKSGDVFLHRLFFGIALDPYCKGILSYDHFCHWMGLFPINSHAFGLKNVPAVFSWVIVVMFKDFIQKFLQVYMDDWTIYGIIRDHLDNFWLTLEWCQQHQIALNSKKCIFWVPFGMLLRHIVCKDGLLVDPTKIALILSFLLSTNVNMLKETVGHTG